MELAIAYNKTHPCDRDLTKAPQSLQGHLT